MNVSGNTILCSGGGAGIGLLVAAAIWIPATGLAQEPVAGTYSPTQVEAGRSVYETECALCHGSDLEGTEAGLALSGSAFVQRWTGLSIAALDTVTRATMPQDGPGSLPGSSYANVLAYILYRNELVRVEPESGKAPSGMVEWLYYRGDAGSQGYSPLEQINTSNVGELQIVWRWRSDNFGPGQFPNLEVTPLMADGVLYATAGSRRTAVAIDAKTGETLWMHRVEEGKRGDNAPRKGPGRGLAYWRGGGEARVFMITPGYQLVAMDAVTGEAVPSFGKNGVVDLKLQLDQELDPVESRIGSSSPPLVVGDVVIVNAAFPSGAAPPSKEMPAGSITAYDVRSGERRWIFHTIPQPGEFGHDSWDGDSWTYTGNVGVWAPMSADPELGYVYLPVEAATGDYYGGDRPGDNLFSQSIVCLDAATGERIWHFQMVHHGIWDYDPPAAPVLLDIRRDGKTIPVVAQITKHGFTFVFDRRNGKPVWPIEERPVPQGDTPGEVYSPTQPFPTLPVPFAIQGTGPESLNNLTPEIHAEAMRIVSMGRSGPLFTPPSVTRADNLGTFFAPSTSGGAMWQGGAADPETGMIYIPSVNMIALIGLVSAPDRSTMPFVRKDYSPRMPRPFGLPLERPPWGTITAIDLNTGQLAWQIANGDTPDWVKNHPKLQGVDVPRTGDFERAGLLVTRTLLFAGEGAGMYRQTGGGTKFRAHDKATGAILAEIDLGARQSGVPMSYSIDGKQYIVVAAGTPGGAGEFIALSLP